jgi:transposase
MNYCEKGQIMAMIESGKTLESIAERFKRNKSTIWRFSKKYKVTGKIDRTAGSGRNRKTTKI